MVIIFVGAGNLATRLSLEMHRVGMTIGQVYSRTAESAKVLAGQLNCSWTSSLTDIREDGDLYVFSLKDSVLEDVLVQMKPNKGLWVHTAGSVPMDIFARFTDRYGVFYPLQTFSKGRTVSFRKIPFFLEASSQEEGATLQYIAQALTDDVRFLPSEKRKQVHLAAVFACNFTNHMYAIASRILEEQGLSYQVLLPLIDETAEKIHSLPPVQAQTGPAVRFDENVIRTQTDMLADPQLKEIYLLISQHIHKEAENE